MKKPTRVVEEIGKINLEGNIIPNSWYNKIRFGASKRYPDGVPDCFAILILADIVYWYRPGEKRDEKTGRIIGPYRKFDADKLQRSYEALAEQFGIKKDHAKDACHRLRDAGLITIEIRHGLRYKDKILNNVVYLEPVPEEIAKITFSYKPNDRRKKK